MPVMLERWNDDKMDALDSKVNDLAADVRGLTVKVDRVGRELGDIRQDFRAFREELHEDVKEMNKRFDAFSRTTAQASVGMATGFVIGWGALVGLIATQL
jgi:uncharacterized protein YoxC